MLETYSISKDRKGKFKKKHPNRKFMRLYANPCSSNRYLTTISLLLEAQGLVGSILLFFTFLCFTLKFVVYSHPISLTTWLMYSSGSLLQLLFPSTNPFIILPSRLLCRNVCPISLAILIFRTFRKLLSSPTLRKTFSFVT